MGRIISALPGTDSARELAQWLESLRQQADLSYEQVAQQGMFSTATIWRATRGTSVPRWQVTEAFVTACGGDLRQARRLWNAAEELRTSRRSGAANVSTTPTLQPWFIRTPAELLQAMISMRLQAGNPSLGTLERRATVGGVTLLPHSSLSAVLRGERMPSRGFLVHFVQACGVASEPIEVWVDAWNRAEEYRRWATGRTISPTADPPQTRFTHAA